MVGRHHVNDEIIVVTGLLAVSRFYACVHALDKPIGLNQLDPCKCPNSARSHWWKFQMRGSDHSMVICEELSRAVMSLGCDYLPTALGLAVEKTASSSQGLCEN